MVRSRLIRFAVVSAVCALVGIQATAIRAVEKGVLTLKDMRRKRN